MSTKTANLGLIKPELTDAADITQMNQNWDAIDAEFQKRPTLDEHGKVPEDQLPDTTYIPVSSEVPSDSDIWIDPDDTTIEEGHISDTSNPHKVTADQVGAIPTTEKGVANGVATLDGNGKVTADQASASVIRPVDVAEYALSNTDMGKMLIFTQGEASVTETIVTLPVDAALTMPIGSEVEISKWNGSLSVTIQCESGVNIRTRLKNTLTQISVDGSYGVIALKRIGDTKWYATGDIA